jgi:serralysin
MSGAVTPPVDLAGNTPSTARAIGTLSATPQVFTDYVGVGDAYDFYKVTVTTNAIVTFAFTATTPSGLDIGRSGLALYGADGTTQLTYADFRTGVATASIAEPLGVGTFYLKVDNPNLPGFGTNYRLSIAATPTATNVFPAEITPAMVPPTGSLQFIDTSVEAQAGRLYQAAFGRAADSAGVAYWAGSLHAGASLVDIAGDFLASAEFQAHYASPDDAGFVTALYKNVLGRAPDAAGLSYWQTQLAGGTATRAQVLASFSESPENEAITPPSAGAQSAARLYWAELGRTPDDAGLTFWTSQLSNGPATLSQEADALASSPEFTTTYGSLDNAAFVNRLYQNVLGRPADAAGLATWTTALAGGASRGSVVIGFSESTEAQTRFAFLDGKFGIVVTP